MNFHTQYSRGAAVITVVMIFLALSILITGASSRLVIGEAERARTYTESTQSFATAESAAEDVIYRLKEGFTVASSESVIVGSTTVVIGTSNANGVQSIGATSTLNNAYRGVAVTVQNGIGMGFAFPVHAGTSGLTLSGSARINGTAFSNASIAGSGSTRINGNASAVGTITAPPQLTVTGTKTTGVSPQAITGVDIPYWQGQANRNNDTYVGNMTIGASTIQNLGPRKIQGNLSIGASSRVTITGPLYVTGNFTLDGSSRLYLASSFGSQGTVILVDGTVAIGASADITPTTATPKGYILIQSNSTNANSAITISGSSGPEVILIAPNGGANITGSADAIALSAQRIAISGSATLGYDSIGFPAATFTGGGTGGGFQIQSWNEGQ